MDQEATQRKLPTGQSLPYLVINLNSLSVTLSSFYAPCNIADIDIDML